MKFWRWVRKRGGTKKGRKLKSFYHGDELVETSMQLWRDYDARLYESDTALGKKKKKAKLKNCNWMLYFMTNWKK